MKKVTIRFLSVILGAVAALSISTPALAAERLEPAPVTLSRHLSDTCQTLALDPRFSYLTRISSSLSINTLGRANCTGAFTTYDEYDSTITIVLQQERNGSWTDIKEWSEDYAGSGIKMLEKGYYVSSGYRYRVITTVQIWDADGTLLEKVSCDSPVKEW